MDLEPFAELYRTTKRSPENLRILNALGDFYTSRALAKAGRKDYDFYEFIGEGLKSEIEKDKSE